MIEKITISSKYYPFVVQLEEKNIISLKDMILRLVAGNSIAFCNFVAQEFPSAKISFVIQSKDKKNEFLVFQPKFSYFDFVSREYFYYYDDITKPIRELYLGLVFNKNDFMNYDFFAKLKILDHNLEDFGVKNFFMEILQYYCSLINPKLLDLFFYLHIGNLKYDNGNYYIVDNLILKKLKSINLDLRGLVDLIENFNKSEISTKSNIDEVMFYIVVKKFVWFKSSEKSEVIFLKIC